jgi:hypothetical protein
MIIYSEEENKNKGSVGQFHGNILELAWNNLKRKHTQIEAVTIVSALTDIHTRSLY